MLPSQPSMFGCFRDRLFWVAMAAGPIVWLMLWSVNGNKFSNEKALPILSLMLVVIVYPVLEEIVFRGTLQGWLRSYKPFSLAVLPGITWANTLVSIVFSLFHLFNQPPVWAILIFFPSLIFGWARDRYSFLTASIVLHSFYNAGFFLLFR